MISKLMINAKAISVETRSDGIVVSFEHKWYPLIRDRAFSVVIRKRIPSSFTPKWLYFHVNSPRSSIVARASLRAVAEMSVNSTLDLANDIGLTRAEILAYVGDRQTIGVFRIRQIELARNEISKSILGQHMSYSPPQSFFILSRAAKSLVDQLCGFSEG
jgi:predicted transcriptional regulator